LSFLAGAGLVLVISRKKPKRDEPGEKGESWETRMVYLEEAVNRAGVLNSNFFHSLELTQKRLEALLTQADIAEQNLRRLLHQSLIGTTPSGGQTDSYSTAAFLLSEGEGIQQVARALKLPLAQVRLLQELRQQGQAEKTAGAQEKTSPSANPELTIAPSRKAAGRRNETDQHGTHFAA
jgi:hypothetical protein